MKDPDPDRLDNGESDPDPDRHHNHTDPQHCYSESKVLYIKTQTKTFLYKPLTTGLLTPSKFRNLYFKFKQKYYGLSV